MDLHQLGSHWPIPGPWRLREAAGGINNLTRFVDTPAGSFVMRLYRPDVDPSRVGYELRILSALQEADLPFAVPTPLPTRTGELFARHEGHLATLVPVLPGHAAQYGDPIQTRSAGEALGALTTAMARLKVEQPAGIGTYGTLLLNAPPVLDVVEGEERDRLARMLDYIRLQIPTLYLSMPQQVIHGDYVMFNLLMQENRVSAVLDFEFAARDLRAIDLACNLTPQWEITEAFAAGYLSRHPLTADEVVMLPSLILLRKAVTFINLTHRYMQGLSPAEHMRYGVTKALEAYDWLFAGGGPELIRQMRALRRHA